MGVNVVVKIAKICRSMYNIIFLYPYTDHNGYESSSQTKYLSYLKKKKFGFFLNFCISDTYDLKSNKIIQNYLQWKSRLISVVRIESHIRKCLPYTCCKNENYGICPPDLQGKKTVNLWVFIYIFKSRSKFLFWYFIIILCQTYLFVIIRATFFFVTSDSCNYKLFFTKRKSLIFFLPLFIVLSFIFNTYDIVWYATLSVDFYQNLRNVSK